MNMMHQYNCTSALWNLWMGKREKNAELQRPDWQYVRGNETQRLTKNQHLNRHKKNVPSKNKSSNRYRLLCVWSACMSWIFFGFMRTYMIRCMCECVERCVCAFVHRLERSRCWSALFVYEFQLDFSILDHIQSTTHNHVIRLLSLFIAFCQHFAIAIGNFLDIWL